MNSSGTLSIVAGIVGDSDLPIPGAATSSPLGAPWGAAVDSQGNLYIADAGNSAVEKVTPAGVLSVVVGAAGQPALPTAGPATNADLAVPFGIAVDGAGDLFVADPGAGVVDKVTPP